MQDKLNVLIIGSGAVGIGIGTALLTSGISTDFLEKNPNTVKIINSFGIKRTGILGNAQFPAGTTAAFADFPEICEKKLTYNFVMISAKSAANPSIAKSLNENRQILAKDGKLIITQNGWGNDTEYLKYFQPEEVFSARVITGFTKPEPNISQVTVHADNLLIGNLRPIDIQPIKVIATAINQGGIPCIASPDVSAGLWAKMLYNCTLNPLGAILNVCYGKLLDSPSSRDIMDKVLEEIFATMEAAGYHSFWQNVEEYKKVFYGKLVPDTYAHKSSTLQDLEKKQKSEIDTLTGSVLKLAKEHNIEVPYNTMLYKLVKSIEDNF